MTGLLYARVNGAWVPIATQANPPFSISPAYAGVHPRYPSKATFSNEALSKEWGFHIDNNTGYIDCSMGPGTSWAIWDGGINQGTFLGKFYKLNTFGALDIGGFTIARPAAQGGEPMIYKTGDDPTLAYRFLCYGDSTYLNAKAGARIYFNVNNTTWAFVDSNASGHQFMVKTRIVSNYSSPTWDHWWADFYGADTGTAARIALEHGGAVAQMRCYSGTGHKMGIINANSSAWAPIGASAFEVSSTIAIKRDVRVLREREHIVVRHDPTSDTVPAPDIMSLRPVAFRPKVPVLRFEYDPEFPDDPTKGEYLPDPTPIFAHEGNRERLGLIAEDVETVVPSAVTHDIDGNCVGIDYAQITVALLDHVQRLTEEVATLRYRIAELEGQP